MNIEKKPRLEDYTIFDYYSPTKKFNAYLWTSAYALANMLYLYSENKYKKEDIDVFINTVHTQLGTHSETRLNLSEQIRNKLNWLKSLNSPNINLIGGKVNAKSKKQSQKKKHPGIKREREKQSQKKKRPSVKKRKAKQTQKKKRPGIKREREKQKKTQRKNPSGERKKTQKPRLEPEPRLEPKEIFDFSEDPLLGTLRIGKVEQNLQEGVYTHYLTKWVHVLMNSAIEFNNSIYFRQACHIMFTTCEVIIKNNRFPRKTKENLFQDHEPNEISHEPLDVFIVLSNLRKNIVNFEFNYKNKYISILDTNIDKIFNTKIMDYNSSNLYTNDELGIGFLLVSIYKLVNLNNPNLDNLIHLIIETSLKCMGDLFKSYNGTIPPSMVFRKCGVSIGLQSINYLTLNKIYVSKYSLERFYELYNWRKLFHESFEQTALNNSGDNHIDINTIMYLVSKNPLYMIK